MKDRLSVFFPMASPREPVGYAEVFVGPEPADAERLPLDNFDVLTVGDAWGALSDGALWPAISPAGTLRWRPSFMGSREEIDAGRSRGKSAHLAILLAVAAWKAGRLAQEDKASLCVWASGELRQDGILKPVESLSHKLRIFVEYCRCQTCRGVFVAPAANRSTIDLSSLSGGQHIKELLFEPAQPSRLPLDGTPAIIWVNNSDVMALVRWLTTIDNSRDGRVAQRVTHVANKRHRLLVWSGVALVSFVAVILAVWVLPGMKSDARRNSSAAGMPVVLEKARFVLHTRHEWKIDRKSILARHKGARLDGDDIVWEESLAEYRTNPGNGCGDGWNLPRTVMLRYTLDDDDFFVGAIGEVSDCLAVLQPLIHSINSTMFSSAILYENYYYHQRIFDPRWTLLYLGMLKNFQSLAEENLISEGPSSKVAFFDLPFDFFNSLDSDIFLVYSAIECCGSASNCTMQSTTNSWCPEPTIDSTGLAWRSFHLRYENPKNSFVSLNAGGADTGNRSWVELDGLKRMACKGPHGLFRFFTDQYPETVKLNIERRWSRSNAEFGSVVVADAVGFLGPEQEPRIGISTNPPPVIRSVHSGWSGVPEILIFSDFEKTAAPWRFEHGDTAVIDRRLRLLRKASDEGLASCDLPGLLDGPFQIGATVALASDQSRADICLVDRRWSGKLCLMLNTSIENGGQKGAFLLCNAKHNNIGTASAAVLSRYRFEPGFDVPHRIELIRAADGSMTFKVDGIIRGRASAERCSARKFDSMFLTGMQDSNPGHGGYFDDLIVARQVSGHHL